MGNDCPECQVPTNECRMRDILKDQPKGRDELDLSHIKRGEYKRKKEGTESSYKNALSENKENQMFTTHSKQPTPKQSKPPISVVDSIAIPDSLGHTPRQQETPPNLYHNSFLPMLQQDKSLPVESVHSEHKPQVSNVVPFEPIYVATAAAFETVTQAKQIGKGMKYVGGMADEQPHQRGKVIWDDGTTLIAEFFMGQLPKKDKVFIEMGEGGSYEGQISKGRANGLGKLSLPDGSSYEGEWKNDCPEGMGRQKMSDGSFYQGQFKNGIKQGRGKFYYQEGMYEGGFKEDTFHGDGILLLNEGQVIKGHWMYGELEGDAEVQWPSGQRFRGEFRKSMRQGRGTYSFSDGREWAGEWSQDQQNGFGTYQSRIGEMLKGVWQFGVKKDEMRSPRMPLG